MIRIIAATVSTVSRLALSLLAAVFMTLGVLSLWSVIGAGERAFISQDLMKYKPITEESIKPDFDDLIRLNPDAAAWLTLYDTNIDYPVLQGRSDMEYINKDIYGNYAIPGSIFLSVMNKSDFSGPYQLIYGHNMENGSMFGDIDKYTDRAFFYNKERIGTDNEDGILVTKERVYDLYVMAIIKTDAFDPIIYKADKSVDEIKETLEYISEKAMYSNASDDASHILAFSTCDGEISYGRLVLICKAMERMSPLPESESMKSAETLKASGHAELSGHLALLNLGALILSLYMTYPLHLRGRIGFRSHMQGSIACLFISAASLAVFIVTEDVMKPMTITDFWTPIMIGMAYLIWVIRHSVSAKAEQKPLKTD